jgi:hypothetical protein
VEAPELPYPSQEQLSLAISKLKPKSLGELWVNESRQKEDEDEDEDEKDEDEDEDDRNVKILPTTREALQKRFN